MRSSLFIDGINSTVREAITTFAIKRGLTYGEAEDQARLFINGIEIKPLHVNEIKFEMGPRKHERATAPKRKKKTNHFNR